MLEIKNITKTYKTDNYIQKALDNISVSFRENEFAAILGPSGSGKTTLLNIIGGLDRYDSGDLIINNISTEKYKDKDWDAYRNRRIGFIFQSYNLIPHQSVLANVELALTLSGISKSERKKRAIEVLEKVGLKDHIHKRPNQLSGGQMQRVAIARALINNPDIILADEPTGALDSNTSIQVMDLLKKAAGEKLVIMVTHNPELAKKYATRIVNVKDGHIVHDSNPFKESHEVLGKDKMKYTKLKFTTALGLSLNNLMTKKGRTALTSFAGSIGIIGIAAILALSSGVNQYIAKQETDMLGSYPLELEKQAIDLQSMMSRSEKKNNTRHTDARIYSNNIVSDSVKTTQEMIKTNDLKKFKTYLDQHQSDLDKDVISIEYKYAINPQVYRLDSKEGVVKTSPASLLSNNNSQRMSSISSMFSANSISASWTQLVSNKKLRDQQYKLLKGKWPSKYNEAALIINKNNEISDYSLYTLGLMDYHAMNDMIEKIKNNKKVKDVVKSFDYSEAIGKSYRVFAPSDLYVKSGQAYVDQSDNKDYLKKHLKDGAEVKITAILQSNDKSSIKSGVGYDYSLTRYLLDRTEQSSVVRAQLSNTKINILTGKNFNEKAKTKTNPFVNINGTSIQSGRLMSLSYTPYLSLRQEEAPKTYQIVFKNYDGTLLSQSTNYSENAEITNIPTDNPQRTSQNSISYTFVGWIYHKDNKYQFLTTNQIRQEKVTESREYIALFVSSSTAADIQSQINKAVEKLPSDFSQISDQQISDYLNRLPKQTRDALQKRLDSYIQSYIKQQTSSKNFNFENLTRQQQEELKKYINKQMKSQLSQQQIDQYMNEYAKKYMNSKNLNSQMKKYLENYMKTYQKEYMNKIKSSMNLDLSNDQLKVMLAQMSSSTPANYDEVMDKLGYYTIDKPSGISFYSISFVAKENVEAFIKKYNNQASKDTDKVTYTDIIGTVTDSITSIIDTISLVLIAFVSISLIVSSIMISIITYISVLERTKEIGILRAMGASKKDISKIFNAETFIEGLLAGLFGIIATLLISVPISQWVERTQNVPNVMVLPIRYSIILIIISVILTLIAGFVPSRIAAKKDPVTALRTE
ncbi:hypothetical protein HMPREF9943_01310 [Eggerthia catenaformis OT 569 = DSM 20559]|uniref:ABC transporter domain-containing protein n=1 Tax=Eggerthia catenaformis OT 569 = DSM 20559 TaxID=999415 RepID=M2PLF5_9FIRM|nr:ABC transporter ATP-binding protein [Eggerthia catenaformis]EMD16384.1 hypothetical protein HMPREF9943_01310 [Eggerthia catenaformis OT 569 = DSM 20559]